MQSASTLLGGVNWIGSAINAGARRPRDSAIDVVMLVVINARIKEMKPNLGV
jgi:hypothetical protein